MIALREARRNAAVRLPFYEYEEAFTEQMLVTCSQCNAWPMSLAPNGSGAPIGWPTFKCPKCRAVEVYTVGVGGRLIPRAGGSR
jgi:hypothetical protein